MIVRRNDDDVDTSHAMKDDRERVKIEGMPTVDRYRHIWKCMNNLCMIGY